MRGIFKDMSEQFWAYLHPLVLTSELIIDRPKGSQHPRYKDSMQAIKCLKISMKAEE